MFNNLATMEIATQHSLKNDDSAVIKEADKG